MIIVKNQGYKLDLNAIERKAFINSVDYIIKDLDTELSTRTGFSIKDYNSLMKILQNDLDKNYVFSGKQLCMIHQAFNEITNGINIPNFELSIGLTLENAKKIFEILDRTIG